MEECGAFRVPSVAVLSLLPGAAPKANPEPTTNKQTTMKVTIKDNILHIEIPLHAPRPSSSGKTLSVASSNGNKPTEATVNGQPVIVGVNAYLKP